MAQDAFAMTILFNEDPPTANDISCGTGTCGDDFVLTSQSVITDAHFWIEDFTGLGDNVYQFQIHADNGAGLPLEPPIQAGAGVVNMAPMSTPGICANCFEVWIDIVPGVPLVDGTYWLAFDTDGGVTWDLIFDIDPNESVAAHNSGDTIWFEADNFDTSFIITGHLVGGELLSIDSTALILAGAQSFSWMIPLMLSVLGIGLFVVTRKSK